MFRYDVDSKSPDLAKHVSEVDYSSHITQHVQKWIYVSRMFDV